ncbi:MAG: acyltransferase [Flavobacteriaceae bacterium]|nr:acyltransferase [Flavobacteriaceae bacterium]
MIRTIKNKILKYLFSHFEQFEQNKKTALVAKFKQVGKNFQIGKDFSVHNPKYMEFGTDFSALERFRIEAWDYFQGQNFTPKIKIGNNVIFNTDIHIGCINQIEIGDNCLFASRIYITDHHHGDTSEGMIAIIPAKRPLISKGAVKIENNVWVGEGVVIMPGVTIGENSIIGANSVVTKSVPKNSVFAGIPAKFIKQLV